MKGRCSDLMRDGVGVMDVAMSKPELPALFSESPRRWAVAGGQAQTGGRDVWPEPPVTEGLELFQQPAAESAEGYERWKAAAAQAREEAKAASRAGELPTLEDDAGYAAWKRDAAEARRVFERRWGVPLGQPVRVQLRGERREREGVLRVAEEPAGPGGVLRLRLGDEVFETGRIESVVRV